MRNSSKTLSFVLGALLWAPVLSSPHDPARALAESAGKATPQVLVAIVAAKSAVKDLSKAMLRRIFLGEPTVHEGVRFVPFNAPPEDPLRRTFDQLLLGFDAQATGRYWIDRRIRGQGLAPRAVPSQALVRAVVAKLPGAIGYIPSDQLDSSVRAVTIDGASHTSPQYPLRVGKP